jgi:opacity protein-like surface antigen
MRKKLILAVLLVLLLSLGLAAVAAAATINAQDLSWHVIGAGGGKSMGPGYEVTGTMGQTAVSSSSGSGDVQSHGFWQDMIGVIHLMLPFTVKH